MSKEKGADAVLCLLLGFFGVFQCVSLPDVTAESQLRHPYC